MNGCACKLHETDKNSTRSRSGGGGGINHLLVQRFVVKVDAALYRKLLYALCNLRARDWRCSSFAL
jgi:hypothetical protein